MSSLHDRREERDEAGKAVEQLVNALIGCTQQPFAISAALTLVISGLGRCLLTPAQRAMIITDLRDTADFLERDE